MLIEDRISEALARWEPRVNVQSVVVVAEERDPESALATIVYRLVATQQIERVTLSVPLGVA